MARNLKGVDQFAASSPFTAGQLRWWIFRAEENGLGKAGGIVRIGRRVYIDEDGFDAWLRAQNPGLPPAGTSPQVRA